MEWSDMEVERCGTYVVRNNYADMNGNVLDNLGLEMQCNNMEVESGEKYVEQNRSCV